MTKSRTPTENEKGKVTIQTPPKCWITQRLEIDLGRSVDVITAIQLMWLTREKGKAKWIVYSMSIKLFTSRWEASDGTRVAQITKWEHINIKHKIFIVWQSVFFVLFLFYFTISQLLVLISAIAFRPHKVESFLHAKSADKALLVGTRVYEFYIHCKLFAGKAF